MRNSSKILLLLFLLLSHAITAQEQSGHLFKQHFQPQYLSSNNFYTDIVQNSEGVMLFASRKHVESFDGQNWRKITTPSSPIKFVEMNDSSFYLLCKKGFGQIKKDRFGFYYYEQEWNLTEEQEAIDLLAYEQKLFLQIDDEIQQFTEPYNNIDTTYQTAYGFDYFFILKDELYAVEGDMISWYDEGVWLDINLWLPDNSSISIVAADGENAYLVSMNGNISRFDGDQIHDFESKEVKDYLQENIPTFGKLYQNTIVIGTLSGGVIIVDLANGKILHYINYYTGLPDDEIHALGFDMQEGLWVSHSYGLSRINLGDEIKRFDTYAGLVGRPKTITYWNNKLWVGTNAGLFVLDKVKDYDALEIVYQKVAQSNIETEDDSKRDLIPFLLTDEEKYVKQKLNDYKKELRKKARQKEINRKDIDALLDKEGIRISDSIRIAKLKQAPKSKVKEQLVSTQTKKVLKLKSIKDQFSKIEGIGNTLQLLGIGDFLIVQTSKGLFSIDAEGKAENIIKDSYIYEVYQNTASNTLWAATDDGLMKYQWDENELIAVNTDEAYHSVQMLNESLLASTAHDIQLWDSQEIKLVESISIDNPFTDFPKLRKVENSLYCFYGNEVYELQTHPFEIKESDYFQQISGAYNELIIDNPNQLWSKSYKEWTLIPDIKALSWVNIFGKVHRIWYDGSNYFWLINEQDQIYRIQENINTIHNINQLLVLSMYDQEQNLLPVDRIKLDHLNNGFTVKLSYPDFIFPEGVEFQYYLKNITDDWSAWSNKSEIVFPYLPTGKYNLEIRARHSLQNDIESLTIPVTITPPYWQTAWFILLEILFFVSLIVVSVMLNRTGKNTYFTQVVTFFTIILFFEMIQFMVEARFEDVVESSPIYNFALNASVALTITPFEKLIRTLLQRKNTKRSAELLKAMKETHQSNANKSS